MSRFLERVYTYMYICAKNRGGKFSPWSINFQENVAVVLRLERISHLRAKVPPLSYNNAVFSAHSIFQRAVDKFWQPREGRTFSPSSPSGHSWTRWFPSLGQWYLNNVRIVKWIDLSLPFNDPRQMRCLASIIRPSNVTSKSRRSVIFSRCSFVRDFGDSNCFSYVDRTEEWCSSIRDCGTILRFKSILWFISRLYLFVGRLRNVLVRVS